MKNILLINGHQPAKIAPGLLSKSLIAIAEKEFLKAGFTVAHSYPFGGYKVDDEVNKFLLADIILYQIPVYWMQYPWTFKKYIDEVFSGGKGKLFKDDGRSRKDGSKKYGSGGKMQAKKYMLSLTWNAPNEALEDPKQLFEGKGNDAVFFGFHKAQSFLGLEKLPTFSCHDVMKKPNIENDFLRFRKHLNIIISG